MQGVVVHRHKPWDIIIDQCPNIGAGYQIKITDIIIYPSQKIRYITIIRNKRSVCKGMPVWSVYAMYDFNGFVSTCDFTDRNQCCHVHKRGKCDFLLEAKYDYMCTYVYMQISIDGYNAVTMSKTLTKALTLPVSEHNDMVHFISCVYK